MQENMDILEPIPKSLKPNVKEELEIYKIHKTDPNKILNDHTSYQANMIFDSAIHLNQRQ